ncbi:hypothetical protein O6V14_09265 [Sphingomonas faeni]
MSLFRIALDVPLKLGVQNSTRAFEVRAEVGLGTPLQGTMRLPKTGARNS